MEAAACSISLRFETLDYLLCKPTSNLATGVYDLDLDHFVNQIYDRPSNVIEADFILGKVRSSCMSFADLDDAYTPDTFDTLTITPYDSTEISKNHKMRYRMTLAIGHTYVDDYYFMIEPPSGFTFEYRCYIDPNDDKDLNDSEYGIGSCKKIGDNLVVAGYSWDSAFSIGIIFGGRNPPTIGSKTFTVKFCQDEACDRIMNQDTISITVANIDTIAEASATSPVERDSLRPIRLDQHGDLRFSIKTDTTAISMKTGYLDITFDTDIVRYDSTTDDATIDQCKAIWTDTDLSLTYMAYDCKLISNMLTVYAPEYTDMPADTKFEILVTIVNKVPRGFLIGDLGSTIVSRRYRPSIINTNYYYKSEWFIPPEDFSTCTINQFVKTKDEMNGFLIEFLNDINAGINYIDGILDTGTTEMLLVFDTTIWENDLGSGISETDYIGDWGQIDCAGLNDALCYLKRGHDADGTLNTPERNSEIWIRNYAAITGTTTSIFILPVTNPAAIEKIIHIKLYVRD